MEPTEFYDKAFGKESALFVGTLWLGMVAKHMDDVRKAEDEAYEFMGEHILKWLNKIRVLYDNIEFKTDIPRYSKEKTKRLKLYLFNKKENNFVEVIREVPLKHLYMVWFRKIQMMWERLNKITPTSENKRTILKKSHEILFELGDCQRSLYREIEKKHLIMPPEKEDMKDLAKQDWHDRAKKKRLFDD